MSNSRRNLAHANAGIVVTIDIHGLMGREMDGLNDLYDSPNHGRYEKFKHFAGMEFQKQMEKKAFEAGGQTQAAPAQRMTDFLKGKISPDLPATSYIPGMVSYPLQEILGPYISNALKQGV